ncbi:MAG TPA: hypothetical protein GX733_08385 [Tissierellia bacterium]|jgi:processive 1,2-diacylglycerol beta-glucosyltransferase|nr:hypothetical protein [Tissierellia bacterium]
MNILLLTCSFGNGHYSAANALKERIIKDFPGASVTLCDLIARRYPKRIKAIYRVYSFFTRELQPLYNIAASQNIRRKGPWSFLQRTCESSLLRELHTCIQSEAPDLIISTYSLTSRLMAEYQRQTQMDIPFVSCITDLEIHSGWVHPETSLYLVASEKTRSRLIENGTSPDKVLVTGIPVSSSFRPGGNKEKPYKRLLVMGGGLGLLPKDLAFYRRLSELKGVKTTVVCARNKRLHRQLLEEKIPGLEVLGFAKDIPERLADADALITKAGGVAVFEAIAAGVPLLLFPPFMKQEIHNFDFIVEGGMGFSLPSDDADSVDAIESLLRTPDALHMCKEQMLQMQHSLHPERFHHYLVQRSYAS